MKPDTKPDFNKLTGKPVLVFFYHLVPWSLGILCQSSVPIIDGYFLGNYVGPEALAVVNLAMPILGLFIAIEVMIATGASIRCGHYLGRGKLKEASRIFTQAILAVFSLIALLALLCILGLDTLVQILGADEALAPQLHEYLWVMLLFTLVLPSAFILEYFVGLDNNPALASAAMMMGATSNIVLTWILVSQLQLGVAGAAMGSGISALISFMTLLLHFLRKDRQLHWTLTKRKWTEVFTTMKNGISDGLSDGASALFILLFNWIVIAEFGLPGLVAMTVVNFLLETQETITFGFGDSLQMLVSANTSARHPERVAQFLRLAMIAGLTLGIGFLLLALLGSTWVSGFFIKDDNEAILLTSQIVIWIFPVFLLGSISVVLMAYFSALEKPLYAGTIALARSFLFPALMLITLPWLLGKKGIFIAIPVAELLTMTLALMLLRKQRQQDRFHQLDAA
ncbi:MATE family efflux transporter [Parendozoicomonas haliclonae]|uniref:Multidrug export protein MepA n=1 Tax=Parendozoicomonas haliclonae TaxID=1960125 RepID=A0A1X7AQ04_9GAMM|nr:MATE family efflux transporter [Parendozoicomonas haliclonae]SMA50178.1 Multidrug export protein MepA [Parendozoicomonas haliclonae]